MNFSKIISLCKESNMMILYDDEEKGMQWISDGSSVYPMLGTVELDFISLCNVCKISESKQKSMTVREHEKLPASVFSFDDNITTENKILRLPYTINMKSITAVPFETSQGVIFIDKDCLAPFSDYSELNLLYYERFTPDNRQYLAVKNGLMLIGIIQPLNIIDGKFISELDNFQKLCAAAWFNIRTLKREKEQKTFGDANEG